MATTSFRLLLATLLGPLLAGCLDGGRGSSGFDLSEALLIQRVVTTQQCLSRDALTFCPADQAATATPTASPGTPTPGMAATPTPTATRVPEPRVDTGVADGTSIACTRRRVGEPCQLVFTFRAVAFGGTPAFRVAAQVRPPGSGWDVAPPPLVDALADPPRYDALVSLTVPDEPGALQVRFAVLVLTSPQATLPERLAVLADSGAELAFVTADLALEVITTEPPPTATATATAAATATAPPNATPTATATMEPLRVGPEITHFGIARADSAPQAPSAFDDAGRPVFVRPFGSGFSLVVEGRPGDSRRPVGRLAYRPPLTPDLQVIVSRPLGDGSAEVCDAEPPRLGGVPAAVPFAFADTVAVRDALDDLGCRVDDGSGEPLARSAQVACTADRTGEFAFVNAGSTVQYCLPIAAPWAFPSGDTIVAARLSDVSGNLGPAREIVLRNAAPSGEPTATAGPPTATATRTPPPSATLAPTFTPTPSRTPGTPTATPTSDPAADGPEITWVGLTRADDAPLAVAAYDDAGRPVVASRLGFGVNVVVEARPGVGGRPPGLSAYRVGELPDLQVIVSRALGDGSAALCDDTPPLIGGVPATVPFAFRADAAAAALMNDLGCRVNDGAGMPLGRTGELFACTRFDEGYRFAADASTHQYCLTVARPWAFPVGDTVLGVRLLDVTGRAGPPREIVVRIERPPGG